MKDHHEERRKLDAAQAEIGTLEARKFADIVIVDGDPLRDSSGLLQVVTTIKGGQVVFEKKN